MGEVGGVVFQPLLLRLMHSDYQSAIKPLRLPPPLPSFSLALVSPCFLFSASKCSSLTLHLSLLTAFWGLSAVIYQLVL